MTVYRVKAPDGKLYDVNVPLFGSEQDAQNYVNKTYPAPQQAGFFQSFKEGFQTAGDAPEALSFAGASPEQEAEKRKALLTAQQSQYARTAARDIKDVSSGLDFLLQNAGQSLGFVAGPGLAGAAATAMKSPGAGRIVGGGLLGLQYLTGNLGRQAGEQQQAIDQGKQADPTSIGRAVIASAGSTALDVLGMKAFAPLFRKFPAMGKMLGEEGEQATKETTEQLITAFRNNTLKSSNGIARAFVRGAVIEVPQEIAQQALERWQAGLSLTDESAMQEYVEAAAGAVALGSGMGAASKYFENASKMAQAEALDRADRNAVGEVQKEARKQTRKEGAIQRQGMTDEDKLANLDNFVRNAPPMSEKDLKQYLIDNLPGLVVNSRDAGINIYKLKDSGVFLKNAAGIWSINPAAPPPAVPTKLYQKPTAPGAAAPAVDPNATPPVVDPNATPPVVDPNAPVVDPNATPPVVDPNATPPVVDPNATPPVQEPPTNLAENITEQQAPAEKPRIDSVERVGSGMAYWKPTLIAENKPLYRETNLSGLNRALAIYNQFDARSEFVTDDKDLALGQGENKGVLVQYRPNSVSGELHKKPATGIIGGQEYSANAFAPDAIDSITFRDPADIKKVDAPTAFRMNRLFNRTANPDGSFTFTRKETGAAPSAQKTQGTPSVGRNESGGAGTSPALPVQQNPAAEAGQTQTLQRDGVGAPVASNERPNAGTQSVTTPLTQHFADIEQEEGVNASTAAARALYDAGLYESPTSTQDEDLSPQREEIETSGSVNQERVLDILSPALYGTPENIANVSIKEILQNSFDAIKRVIKFNPNHKGKISFEIGDDKRSVTAIDNGIGMAPELLGGQFLEIAGTSKEEAGTEDSSGGFGVAKALFLYSNKTIHVITMNNGIVSEMKTTGIALRLSLKKEHPDYAPIKINVYGRNEASPIPEEMAKLFPDGHGTWTNISIDEDFVDPKDGVRKPISEMPANPFAANALRYSLLFRDIEVKYIGRNEENNPRTTVMPIGANLPSNIKPFASITFNWGDVRAYLKPNKYSYPHNVQILSNGLWQFSGEMYIDPVKKDQLIPYEIYFDISPRVKPSQVGYPFTLNRQSFTEIANKDFNAAFSYVNRMFKFLNFAEGVKSYGNIKYIEKQTNGEVTTSVGEDLTPTMPNLDNDFAPLTPEDKIEIVDGILYLNDKPMPTFTAAEVADAVPDTSTLKIDPSKINPNKVMLHDNTDVVNHQTKKTTSVIDAMSEEFGKQNVDSFLFEVGDTFLKLRNLVADVMGYDELKKEAIGISIDSYRGVSTRVPLSGSFVNPFFPEADSQNIYKRANGIFGTMIHELAHHKERNHNANFPAEMQRIQYALESLTYELADNPEKAQIYNKLRQEFVNKIASNPVYNEMMTKFTELAKTTEREKYGSKTISLKTRQQSLDPSSSFERPQEGGVDGTPSGVSSETGGTTGGQGVPTGSPTGSQPAQNGGKPRRSAKKTGRTGAVKKNLPTNSRELVQNNRTVRVPKLREASPEEAQKNLVRDMTNVDTPSIRKSLWGLISSFTGFETAVKNLQNSRRPLKTLQDFLQATKRLVITGKGYNNLFDQITLSTGRAFNALNLHMTRHINDLDNLVVKYSKESGLPLNDALARLHVYMMGLHEPERRAVKYLFNVPLENDDTKKNYKLDGVAGTALENVRNTPHELRMTILRELYNAKNKISNDFDANGLSTANKYRAALEKLVENHKSNAKGKSGTSMRDVDASTMSLDIASGEYNVIGLYTVDSIKKFKESYERDPNKNIVDGILKKMKDLGDATTELSKRSHYWSPPVTNISAFYNWDYYVPFKGKGVSYVSEGDDRFELRGKSMGGGMTEFASEFGGRESDSDNPILQVKVDAIKAAMRDGRHGTSQALVNLINAKYIKGAPIATIRFEDRYNGLSADVKEKLKGENLFYHYLLDGTIKVYRVTDPAMREAIRQSYEAPNPLMSMMASVTNFMGHTHTRWNPSFHPYNFVRDILTNAFTFGAEFGPAKAFQLIESVTSTVINRGGFAKSAKVSLMYNEGKVKELQEMAKTDLFIRDLMEYLEEGGKVSYIMGLSNKSQLEELLKDIDASGFSKAKNAITKYLDVWGDVFEMSSRAATYSALKSTYLAEGMSEAAARQQAAAYAKNLANFEQIGVWGRDLGSLFMFFRPAATGAVRALDAIKTALFSAEQMMETMPDKLKNDPKAVEEFKKNHAEKKKKAIQMMSLLAAAGAAIFTMAMIASDDDEAVPPRNKIATDDMSLWTRNIRLPLSILGKDNYLQIPWGFGLGAFAAAGAQIAGASFGASGFKDIAPNFVTLALDSYVPIPVSRLDPRDNLGMWFLDSVSPSFLRPILEFTVNTDSLGREIYNNRLTKYGDPYIAGKNVPELYRNIAVGMSELTNGRVQIQPGSIQFWSSNLADGFARMAVTANNAWMLATDQSKFNPKTDTLIFGSFFGQKSNYDARQFAELENKMKEYQQTYRMFERDEKQLTRWLKDHPNMDVALYVFNQGVNGQLRTLRADYNATLGSRIRNDDGTELTPMQRKQRVEENLLMQNAIKRDFIAMMEQYKID